MTRAIELYSSVVVVWLGALCGLAEAVGKTRAAAEAGVCRRPGGTEAVLRTDREGRGGGNSQCVRGKEEQNRAGLV